jgi:hypothetical protein
VSTPADQGLAARALAEQTRQHMEAAKAAAEAAEAAQQQAAQLQAGR